MATHRKPMDGAGSYTTRLSAPVPEDEEHRESQLESALLRGSADMTAQESEPRQSSFFSMFGRQPAPARFLDRDAEYQQSKGKLNVQRINQPHSLRLSDILHELLHLNTCKLTLLILLVYSMTYMFFAPFFWLVRVPCGSEPCHLTLPLPAQP